MILTPLLTKRKRNPVEAPVYTTTFSGVGKLASFKANDPYYTFGTFKGPDGNYYTCAMGRYDNNRDPYIIKYNPNTNTIDQSHRILMGVASADSHRSPCITFDSSGHIYVAVEILQAGNPGGHATNMRLYKTTTPYDLSTLALKNTLTGRYSYAFVKVDGSIVWMAGRGTTNTSAFIRGKYQYFLSSNGGTTFGSAQTLYDSGNEQKVAYFNRIHSYSSATYMVLNERDNDLQNWTFISCVKTTDYITWSNVQGTWSKNIVTSGAITRAEMLASCLVLQSPDTTNIAVNFEGGIVKSDGSVKMAVSMQSLTGNFYIGNPETNIDSLRFYYYSSGWLFNNVDIPSGIESYPQYDRKIQYCNSDATYDDILFINMGSNRDIELKRSYNNFATTTTTKKVDGNGRYMLGSSTYNAVDESDYFFCIDNPGPTADIFEIYAEGAEDYSDLLLVKL